MKTPAPQRANTTSAPLMTPATPLYNCLGRRGDTQPVLREYKKTLTLKESSMKTIFSILLISSHVCLSDRSGHRTCPIAHTPQPKNFKKHWKMHL